MVCAFSGKHASKSVFLQELNAIQAGVQMALMEGISKLEVASDSMRVIKAINKKEAPPWDGLDQYSSEMCGTW
ncbi:hypothetical protein FRX31_008035 [Thalictrum thalictroides]|uniref:RNase H type-1 domain-containing protein n=1 Tax=Thalictrum thalictroides TaxID=46969 RepID=A0A7J6X0X7_THATH|nr:hypothetical protein FRX31_008035 [Thalictrum thalictroides]